MVNFKNHHRIFVPRLLELANDVEKNPGANVIKLFTAVSYEFL